MAQYDSLKDYLSLNRKDDIINKANEYLQINNNNNILKDIEILTVRCLEDLPFTAMLFVDVKAEVYNVGSKVNSNQYYGMITLGTVISGFSDMTVSIVGEISEDELQEEDVCSLFGLPEISKDDLEEKAEKIHSLLMKRIPRDSNHKYRFSPVKVKEKNGIKMWPAELNKGVLGQIRFTPSKADIYNIEDMSKCYYNEPIPANSILLNSDYYKEQSKRYDDIIVATHELVHWSIHQLYFNIMRLLEGSFDVMNCSSDTIVLDDSMSLKEKAYWYAEWQANELAMRVAIPKRLIKEAISEYESDNGDCHHDGYYYQNMIYKLSGDFNVPGDIMKKRFRQLGYDFADGTFINVDECYYKPFSFDRGSLKGNETFVIDRSNYERLLREDNRFAKLIENRYYMYTGYVICVNDAKYISPVSTKEGLCFALSDYAREHADKCCLKFSQHEKQCVTTYTEFVYLCKLDDGKYSNERGLTQDAHNDLESYKRIKKDEKEAQGILVDMDKAKVVSFQDALRFHMSRLNIEPEDMSDELYLKGETFLSYYKGNRKPSLKKAMLICNKLNLPYKLCIDLLKRARITLNTDEKEDEFYDYLLTITNASLEDWDMFLIDNGLGPLGDQLNES